MKRKLIHMPDFFLNDIFPIERIRQAIGVSLDLDICLNHCCCDSNYSGGLGADGEVQRVKNSLGITKSLSFCSFIEMTDLRLVLFV